MVVIEDRSVCDKLPKGDKSMPGFPIFSLSLIPLLLRLVKSLIMTN